MSHLSVGNGISPERLAEIVERIERVFKSYYDGEKVANLTAAMVGLDELKDVLAASEQARKQAEQALRLATHAFAQYALGTNDVPDQVVEDFAEGFRQSEELLRVFAHAAALAVPGEDTEAE